MNWYKLTNYIPFVRMYRMWKLKRIVKKLLGVDRVISYKQYEKEQCIFIRKLRTGNHDTQ